MTIAATLVLCQAGLQYTAGVQIHNITIGVWITTAAAVINLALGIVLLRIGWITACPLLRASGMHILTDVWSSAATLTALILLSLTDWLWRDPVFAIAAPP